MKRGFLLCAERVGFEPTVRLRAQRFSRPPDSTTLAPLRLITACQDINYYFRYFTHPCLWERVGWIRYAHPFGVDLKVNHGSLRCRSNPRYELTHNGFRDRLIQPLSHLSVVIECKIKKPLNKEAFVMFMSGKRDSNSRPQPWQGCALPTELFPLEELL